MRKLFALTVLSGFLFTGAGIASAKCYHFSGTPSDTYVCVKDDDRKKAKKILENAGLKPSSVSSYSSSCHSNKGNCYDENGKKHRSLKGY